MGQMINALVGKLKGRDSGKQWHECEYNIEMDLKEIGWEGVDWIHLVQDRDR
jgi:hypothetical protein